MTSRAKSATLYLNARVGSKEIKSIFPIGCRRHPQTNHNMAKNNPVKKHNFKINAELKTIADYALILEHCNGYSRSESNKLAKESQGEELFEKLLSRNLELFQTGEVVLFG